MEKIPLGKILLKANIIDQKQLDYALAKQKQSGIKLGQILIEEKLADEKAVYESLAKQLNIPFIDLAHYDLDYTLTKKLQESYARRYQAILLEEDTKGNYFLVGMIDPQDIFAIDELQHALSKKVKPALITERDLAHIIDLIYRRDTDIKKLAGDLLTELQTSATQLGEEVAIKQADTSIAKLIDSLFEDAIQVNASDIHIEPTETFLRIRLRVDGLLQEQIIPTKEKYIANAISQKLKLLANLNISERRLPQDGSFNVKIRGMNIDVRLSTMPLQFGESIVMRLLNQSANLLHLSALGMPTDMTSRFSELIKLPRGIILVTGPTGSGKTTTLYGALSEINDVAKNIITIEDPIEYRIDRLNQVQVNSALGLTFARILRASLRQDPNVILVGEIRDQETASIALRAALTGHLVFATLHTNDAVSTIIRLVDIGVENYLVAATVRAALAQRLVRRICDSCTEDYSPTPRETIFLSSILGNKINDIKPRYGKGCTNCNFSGYKGRTGVYELLEFEPNMLEALRRNDTDSFYKIVSQSRKTKNLLENALDLAAQGITTIEEVIRVAGEIV
jgi:MSHA biogenesis protein MshE